MDAIVKVPDVRANGCRNRPLQSLESITVTRSLAGGKSKKKNRFCYDTPKPCLFSIVL